MLSTTKINRRSRNIFEFLKVQKKLFNKFVTFIILKLSFSNNIITKLEQYVKKFPSIDNLPLFYQDIIDIKLDKNKLKKSTYFVILYLNWLTF